MRKILLLLSIVSAGFFLNSCMDAGEQNMSGSQQLFFIEQTTESGQIAYNGAMAMTSEKIKMQQPGLWYLISWQWSSSNGMTNNNVYNAVTTEVEKVPLGSFALQSAPEATGIVPFIGFNIMDMPLATTYRDYLLFPYSLQKAEGEQITLRMYSTLDAEAYKSSGYVTIDARLEKTGTATGSAKNINDVAAVRMSALRNLVTFATGDTYKDVIVRFRYHKDASSSTETPSIQIKVYKN